MCLACETICCCKNMLSCFIRWFFFIMFLIFFGLILFQIIGYEYNGKIDNVLCPKLSGTQTDNTYVFSPDPIKIPKTVDKLNKVLWVHVTLKWTEPIVMMIFDNPDRSCGTSSSNLCKFEKDAQAPANIAVSDPAKVTTVRSLSVRLAHGTYYIGLGVTPGEKGCSSDTTSVSYTVVIKLSDGMFFASISICIFSLGVIFWPCIKKCLTRRPRNEEN